MKKYFYVLFILFSVSLHAQSQSPSRANFLPDISVIGSMGGGYFTMDPTVDVGHDPARTGFTLQEIELALSSVVDPYLKGDVFFSFHEEGVELEEGYITTMSLPYRLQVKAGKMFMPFGRQNQKHLHRWDFADTMLVNKAFFGPEGLSELGVNVSYLFPTPFFLQLEGAFGNGDNETSFGGTRKEDFLYQGRLSTSFDLPHDVTLLAGYSLAIGQNNTGAGNEGNDTIINGGDVFLKWKPSDQTSVSWQTEYMRRSYQGMVSTDKDGGLYTYVDYQFRKRWHAGLRYDRLGLPEGLIQKEWKVTPAIAFDPTEFSRVRLQYGYDKVGVDPAIQSVFLQLQFSMGPHGAHNF